MTPDRAMDTLSRLRRRVRGLHASDEDRGFGTVEAVLTIPVMVLMILARCRSRCGGIATSSPRPQRRKPPARPAVYLSTADAGQAEGYSYLNKVDRGSTALHHPAVNVTRGAKTVTVTVKGDMVSLVPFVCPRSRSP